MVKNLPAVQETQVWSLGQEDPLWRGMATHSNILAWRSPWTAEPGGLQSMGLQRVRHRWATNTFWSRRPQGRGGEKGEKNPLLYENFTQSHEQTLCSFTLVFSHFSANQFSYHPRLVTTAEDIKKYVLWYLKLGLVIKSWLADKIKCYHYSCLNHSVVWSPCKTTRISFITGKDKRTASCMIKFSLNSTEVWLGRKSKVKFQVDTIYCFYYSLTPGTDSGHPVSFPCYSCLTSYQWSWNLRVSYASVKSNDGLYSFDLLKCPLIWFDICSYRKNMLLWLIKILTFQNLCGYYSLGDHNSYGEMCME